MSHPGVWRVDASEEGLQRKPLKARGRRSAIEHGPQSVVSLGNSGMTHVFLARSEYPKYRMIRQHTHAVPAGGGPR